MTLFEQYLKVKNQHQREVEEELRQVKEVAKREPSLRICVKRTGLTRVDEKGLQLNIRLLHNFTTL